MLQLLNIILAAVLARPFYYTMISSAMTNASMGIEGEAAMDESMASANPVTMLMVGPYGLYVLAAFVPSIAITVRRLHDRDMSGWWYLGFYCLPLSRLSACRHHWSFSF